MSAKRMNTTIQIYHSLRFDKSIMKKDINRGDVKSQYLEAVLWLKWFNFFVIEI